MARTNKFIPSEKQKADKKKSNSTKSRSKEKNQLRESYKNY